jgi:hypothetical protein
LTEERKKKMSALNNPVIALVVSLIITVGYFVLVDHYLMDMQGLDFWYLFKN